MSLTKEQEKELQEMYERKKLEWDKYQKYTHEELAVFRKEGVEGQVCVCQYGIANSMTLECLSCGKIQMEYAKKYAKRNENNKL